MPGRLIVFEGVEGCGKTTQIARSQTWLQESGLLTALQNQGEVSRLIVTREPGGTELCQEIRQLLLHPTSQEAMQDRTELLLYAADRAQHVAGFLKPQLAQGALILCDRFTDSTVAYQGYGRGLDRGLIGQLNQIATDGLTSDLTLWLDLEAAVGLARAQSRGMSDRIEQAALSFHQRVQQGFTELAQDHPQRIVQINGDRSETEVFSDIQRVLEKHLQQWYKIPAS
ncbi:MAG: dTMP kinase [Drouetiella hepatica Uher 2000/2452]|jgi:dTMP kinase|uniref:Thymidylate kinase n=1 Tax=Drouetiella hepatica Uher 2000/2452 TaxID=904376 RepID=A0A951QAE4_9CYAN|nr:dTMP kinase [Drouetiella hepatica Uher 2000/2452]